MVCKLRKVVNLDLENCLFSLRLFIGGLIIFVSFLQFGFVVAQQTMVLDLSGNLNNHETLLYLQVHENASLGLDSFDVLAPSQPNGAHSFYSVINSGGLKNLMVDSWNSSFIGSRVLNLTYNTSGVDSIGILNISWNPVNLDTGLERYFFTLNDFGSDSSRTILNNSRDMRSFSFYSVSNIDSARYFSVNTSYFYCGDGICSAWENCGNCFADCACPFGQVCENDICVVPLGSPNPGGGGPTNPPPIECTPTWTDVSPLVYQCSNGIRQKKQQDGCGDERWVDSPCSDNEICMGAGDCVSSCIMDGCSEGYSCNSNTGLCEVCQDTCSSLGFECGERNICNKIETCGLCGENENCYQGKCFASDQIPLAVGDSILGDGNFFVREGCLPNYQCSSWSKCIVSYDSLDLLMGKSWFKGKKNRVCSDLNGCSLTISDSEDCQLKLDVEIKEESLCGILYLSVYDKSNGELLARTRDSRQNILQTIEIFLLPGDLDCVEESFEFNISSRERLIFSLNIRNLWRLLR